MPKEVIENYEKIVIKKAMDLQNKKKLVAKLGKDVKKSVEDLTNMLLSGHTENANVTDSEVTIL